eukprot:TRINITY_DN78703_c0_g1_i1.p1 TRINITY_DN78703_c0_g1~~TRINITY_DN78703_c0_g1_i1.p1  ORF type:complete len:603 (-),score=107.75 TRINITY_DN78703_c0_g1_i1:4-1770(-)
MAFKGAQAQITWLQNGSEDGQDSGHLVLQMKNYLFIDRRRLARPTGAVLLKNQVAEPELQDGNTVYLFFTNDVTCVVKLESVLDADSLREECKAAFQKNSKSGTAHGGLKSAVAATSAIVPEMQASRKRRNDGDDFGSMSVNSLGAPRGISLEIKGVAEESQEMKRRSIDAKVSTLSPHKQQIRYTTTMRRAPAPSRSSLLQRRPSAPQDSSTYGGYRSSYTFGLQNLGNTCYLNAVTQALCSLREFVNDLCSMPKLLPQFPEGELFKRTVHILTQMKETGVTAGPLSPAKLREQIALAAPMFRGSGQQDAHEFLLEFVNQLHDELLSSRRAWLSTVGEGEGEDDAALATQVHFDSEVQKQLVCIQCQQSRILSERFRDFSLDFPDRLPAGGACSLSSMLSAYFQRELVEAKCAHCTATAANMEKCLTEPPRVLVLHLKRFIPNIEKQCYEKQHQSVDIPSQLDLSSVGSCSSTAGSSPARLPARPLAGSSPPGAEVEQGSGAGSSTAEGPRYSLRAIVAHEGSSPRSGHYVSYARSKDGVWRLYDDSRVTVFSKSEEPQKDLGRKAYILFYVLNSPDGDEAGHGKSN